MIKQLEFSIYTSFEEKAFFNVRVSNSLVLIVFIVLISIPETQSIVSLML